MNDVERRKKNVDDSVAMIEKGLGIYDMETEFGFDLLTGIEEFY